ncbi:hypothetical protein C1646_676110 [Rhizophagus diaphanus]|nr:hypothetical protein C1646_676110 [Rhizophagus diaphanus] [Rhizophagus sp. MUCL 43196]
MAFYRCPYILRTGEVCNRGCFHPKGCQIHQNSPSYMPCIVCGKRTYSEYGFCDPHARKHCKRGQYHQKKLAKMALVEILLSLESVLRKFSLRTHEKGVMKGRIAHLGHQFGTSCLIPDNQKGHTRQNCKNGHKFGTSCLILDNQKGHRVEKQTSALLSDQTVTDQ